jgi:hypothetical protein
LRRGQGAVMASTCEGTHYTCGDTVQFSTGSVTTTNLQQLLNDKLSFMLGVTEIVVAHRVRNFNISIEHNVSNSAEFAVIVDGGGTAYCNSEETVDNNNSISENCNYVTTKLYFLDTRYNHAIGEQKTEVFTFNLSSSEMAEFKETWGQVLYPKFHIVNGIIHTTVEYFIVINGVKTVLETVETSENVYTAENPLIIVYPNPPSLAIPWVNCEDIIQFGFYDYHAVGDEEGQVKIRRDGGDDFYFTDWMRLVGVLNLAVDQAKAEERYFAYYLDDGGPATSSITNPGVFVSDTPAGNIVTNNKGVTFYSVVLNGKYYNGISEGLINDILTATKMPEGINPRLYPVGII